MINTILEVTIRELDVNLFMAIVDFIPVILFMIGMGYVIKIAYKKVSKNYFAVLCGGVFLGFMGGMSKCIWKLIANFGIDYAPLNISFSIYQAVGFTLIAVGIIALAVNDRKPVGQNKLFSISILSTIPYILIQVRVISQASFLWFVIMSIFTTVYLIAISTLCLRRKMYFSFAFYYVSMVLMFSMAALANKFDVGGDWASLNWLAQIVNCMTQFFMALPTYLLYKKLITDENQLESN